MRGMIRFVVSVVAFGVVLLILGLPLDYIKLPPYVEALLYVPIGLLAFALARAVWSTMAGNEDIRLARLSARNLARTYIMLKIGHPDATDRDLFEEIVNRMAAVPGRGEPTRLSDMRQAAVEAANAGEFIARLVAIGFASSAIARLREDTDAGRMFVRELTDAVNDELRKAFTSSNVAMREG